MALAVAAVFFGALAQALTGFGFSLVSAPFLVAAAAAPRGVAWNLMLSAAVNLVLLGHGYRQVRWREVVRMLVPAVVATVVFGLLARHANRAVLTTCAGTLCLAATAAVGVGVRIRHLSGRGGAAVAGGISGAMNVVSGIGGPPVVIYGVNAGWPAAAARPTLQAFFFGINAAAIPSLGLRAMPLVLPVALVVGLVSGVALSGRIAERGVRRAVIGIAAVGSVLAIGRGIVAL